MPLPCPAAEHLPSRPLRPLDDARRGELVFRGDLLVFKSVPPLLEAASALDGFIGDASAAPDLTAIDELQRRVRDDPHVKRLFRAALEHVGVDAERSYWDSIHLRVVPPVERNAERQIGRIGFPATRGRRTSSSR